VDFLLVLIELFRYVLRLRATSESGSKLAISLQSEQADPKF